MLQFLGLSGRAEAAYRAMLRHPDHGVADLAKDTGLPELDVRCALDELGDLELLKPSSRAGGGVRPVSPEVGLAALLAAAEADAAARQAQIEATRAEIAAIAAQHERTRDWDGALRLEGLDAVRSRLEEIQRLTETEILSLNSGGADKPDARDASGPLNEQALKRGVMIRAVCRDSFRNDPDTLAYAEWLVGLGGQMRTVPSVPIPLIVVDRKLVILPLDIADPRIGALEVHSPPVVAVVHALFESIWAVATPFGATAPTDEHGCSPMERVLLDLISSGCTDDAAARKLGVSLRTVRRMMAGLMFRLDASSRFQAGLNAAKRGWL